MREYFVSDVRLVRSEDEAPPDYLVVTKTAVGSDANLACKGSEALYLAYSLVQVTDAAGAVVVVDLELVSAVDKATAGFEVAKRVESKAINLNKGAGLLAASLFLAFRKVPCEALRRGGFGSSAADGRSTASTDVSALTSFAVIDRTKGESAPLNYAFLPRSVNSGSRCGHNIFICMKSCPVGGPEASDVNGPEANPPSYGELFGDGLASSQDNFFRSVDFHLGRGQAALADANFSLALDHFERAAVCSDQQSVRLLCQCRQARVLCALGTRTGMQLALSIAESVVEADGDCFMGHETMGHWLLQEAEAMRTLRGTRSARLAARERRLELCERAVAAFGRAIELGGRSSACVSMELEGGLQSAQLYLREEQEHHASLAEKAGDRAVDLRHFSSAAKHYTRALGFTPACTRLVGKHERAHREAEMWAERAANSGAGSLFPADLVELAARENLSFAGPSLIMGQRLTNNIMLGHHHAHSVRVSVRVGARSRTVSHCSQDSQGSLPGSEEATAGGAPVGSPDVAADAPAHD